MIGLFFSFQAKKKQKIIIFFSLFKGKIIAKDTYMIDILNYYLLIIQVIC